MPSSDNAAVRFARAAASDLVLVQWTGRAWNARAACWLLVLAAFCVVRAQPLLSKSVPLAVDGHAIASLNEAMNEAYCDKYAVLSDRYQIASTLSQSSALTTVPLRQVIAQTAGSMSVYCSSLRYPFGNNETALEWGEAQLLRVLGVNGSVADLGRRLVVVRLAMLAAFAGAVFLSGGSVLLAAGVIDLGVRIADQLTPFTYSAYAFFAFVPLCCVALYVMALRVRRAGGSVADLALLMGIGAVSAFGANVRSSHLPVYAALLVCYIAFGRARGRSFGLVAVSVACIAYVLSSTLIVRPREPRQVSYNSSYHAIAHPLVLSLGLPENVLTRREGIRWDDGAGLPLARRIDPTVTYLGAGYESALLRYYVSLWRRYPGLMAAIYLNKFELTGDTIIQHVADEGTRASVVFWPWSLLRNGFMRFWGAAALLMIGVLTYEQLRAPLGALLGMVSLAAILLHLEATLIVPRFTIQYHSYSAFYAGFVGLVLAQAAITLWVPMGRPASDDVPVGTGVAASRVA